MRILYVTAHYPPDFVSGATLQVRRLAESLSVQGHNVTVLSGAVRDPELADGDVRREDIGGVTIHWLGTTSRVGQDVDENWLNRRATEVAVNLMDAIRPDIVHGHALQTLGAEMLSAAAARGVPTVVTLHDFWWWCPRLFLVDRELRPCDGLLPTSDCPCAGTADWRRRRRERLEATLATVDLVLVPSGRMASMMSHAGIPISVEVDENDIDVALHGPQPWRPDDIVRFLYVGGDSPLKGRDVVLAAAELLRDLPGWQLDLYGVTPPARSLWRRRHQRRIRYLSPYSPDETGAVLAGADVLLIASIARESFSIVAREALRIGRAVITSDCVGPQEVVEDGYNGLVVPSGDARALAVAMRRVLEQPELLPALQQHAHDRPISIRDPADHARDLIARYDELQRRTAR